MIILELSFTGTQAGMTEEQKHSFAWFLEKYTPGRARFHHGMCVGADADAARIAHRLGRRNIAHPSDIIKKRAKGLPSYELLPAATVEERWEDIPAAGEALVAAPRLRREERRSGTWATVRRARKQGKPVIVIWPDGSIEWERRYEEVK